MVDTKTIDLVFGLSQKSEDILKQLSTLQSKSVSIKLSLPSDSRVDRLVASITKIEQSLGKDFEVKLNIDKALQKVNDLSNALKGLSGNINIGAGTFNYQPKGAGGGPTVDPAREAELLRRKIELAQVGSAVSADALVQAKLAQAGAYTNKTAKDVVDTSIFEKRIRDRDDLEKDALDRKQRREDAALGVQSRKILRAQEEFEKKSEGFGLAQRFLGDTEPALKQRREFARQLEGRRGLDAGSISTDKLSPLFDPRRLLKGETLSQLAFAQIYGGTPSVLAGAVLGSTPLLGGGVALGAKVAQGVGALIEPILHAFTEVRGQFEEAGKAYERSILGIASVLQSTTQVFDRFGNALRPGQIADQLSFQTLQAKKIQGAARAELRELGVGGSQEALIVQSLVAGLAQRGITGNAKQIAGIARNLTGAVLAQNPTFFENTTIATRDLLELAGGSPNASRLLLSQYIRPALGGIKQATSAEGFLQATNKLSPFADALQNSDSIVTVFKKIEGALDSLRSAGGVEFFETAKKGYSEFLKVLKDPEVERATKTIGAAMGSVTGASVKFTAGLTSLGARIVNILDPLGRLLGVLGQFPATATAVVAAITALTIAEKERAAAAALASRASILSGAANPLIRPGAPGFFNGLGRGLSGVASIALGPGAIPIALAGAGLAFLTEQQNQKAADQEAKNARLEEQAQSLRAVNSQITNKARLGSILTRAGLKEEVDKAQTEGQFAPEIQLQAIRRANSLYGKSPEQAGDIAALNSIAPGLLEKAFERSTVGIDKGSISGQREIERLKREELIPAERKALEQRILSDKLKAEEDRKNLPSINDERETKRKEIEALEGKKLSLSSEYSKFGERISERDRGIKGDIDLLGPGSESVREKQIANQVALGQAKKELADIDEKLKDNASTLTAADNDRLQAERELAKLKVDEAESIQKEIDLLEKSASFKRSAFKENTPTGALELKKAVLPDVQAQIAKLLSSGREEDFFRAQHKRFEEFDLQGLDRTSDNSFFGAKKAGIDAFTLPGEQSALALDKQRNLLEDARLRDQLATQDTALKANPQDKTAAQLREGIIKDLGGLFVERQNIARREPQLDLEGRQLQTQLSNTLSEEIAKRTTLNLQLQAGDIALKQFRDNLDQRFGSKEKQFAGALKEYEAAGGVISPALKNIIDNPEFNKKLAGQNVNALGREVGLGDGLVSQSGPELIPRFSGGSDFAKGVAAEGEKLKIAVGDTARELAKLPETFEAIFLRIDQRLGIQHNVPNDVGTGVLTPTPPSDGTSAQGGSPGNGPQAQAPIGGGPFTAAGQQSADNKVATAINTLATSLAPLAAGRITVLIDGKSITELAAAVDAGLSAGVKR
jgi:hypothetical protein